MTLAKEMLVTHSSSFLMFFGSTVWHKCLGSMVRFTSGILLLRRLYLQRGEKEIRRPRRRDCIILFRHAKQHLVRCQWHLCKSEAEQSSESQELLLSDWLASEVINIH